MELKQREEVSTNIKGKLLIVPYGIETTGKSGTVATGRLLIVPYGIETNYRSDGYVHQVSF